MPTYAYVCTACEHRFEIVQAIVDSSLTACPECGGALRKVFRPVGVAFKGSGFYRTDSRAAESNAAAEKKSDTKTDSKSDSNGSATPGETGSKSSETKSTSDAKTSPAKGSTTGSDSKKSSGKSSADKN